MCSVTGGLVQVSESIIYSRDCTCTRPSPGECLESNQLLNLVQDKALYMYIVLG